MRVLTKAQHDAFWRSGFLMLEDAVTPAQLAGLTRDFDGWVAESKGHKASYGQIVDGRPRFDLHPDHSAARPQLRRVNAPCDV